MQTRFDFSIEPLSPSVSFIDCSSKQRTSCPTCTVFISSIHNRSTLIFTDLFRLSHQLPSQPSPFPPPPLRATRRLLLPSNMHHRNLLLPQHPRLLLHHHYSHYPSANVSLHHPSTKMRIGMLGTLMQIPALSSSKLILVSARTGTTLPVE